MGKLSIAYLGNFGVDFTTESQIAATLEDLSDPNMGHRVVRLQENKVTLPDILARRHEVDFLLWTRTGGWLRCNGFEMLQRIKMPTVGVHLDLFWGLNRELELKSDPYWNCTLNFSADGGHQDEFKALGINHFWLNPGVLRRECYLAEPREDLKCDVGFTGSENYHSEWPRKQLIEFLRTTYKDKFRLFGAHGDSWRGHALNQVFASARVMVGDSCFAGKFKNYTSDRLGDYLGRGAFFCYPAIEGITEEFTEGVHLRLYNAGDYAGLKLVIDDMLAMTDEQRMAMRRAAVCKALSGWTWNHRMKQLLDTVATHEPAIAARLAE